MSHIRIIKLLDYIFNKKLDEPTQREKELIKDLQNNILNINYTLNNPASSVTGRLWEEYICQLKKQLQFSDPRIFLHWEIIQKTMFIRYAPYIFKELRFLKKSKYWRNRWKHAIKESFFGYPTPYIFYPKSSANLIHHTYHLAQFEEKMNVNLDEIDFILEFGGGYGSICRLFFNLNFKGKYLIYDLPYFVQLQEYYLKNLNLPVLSVNEFNQSECGIICTSDLAVLDKIIKEYQGNQNLFIATWSLSEAPLDIRDSFVKLILNFNNFLIGYQNIFGELNNLEYFNNFSKLFNKVSWLNLENNNIQGSNYLFGNKK